MEKIKSEDGTAIAFDRLDDGQPVIVVGGATCDRAMTRPLAKQLARHFTVFNYDRRGDAVELYMTTVGMPQEMVEGMRHDPTWAGLEDSMMHVYSSPEHAGKST